MRPEIHKARRIGERTPVFRDVTVADAGFILSLRTDMNKARYLSTTSADLAQQASWLEKYATDTDQAYFIIMESNGVPLGTVRLYDPQGVSFCWRSWILQDGAPSHAAIESDLIVYAYAIDHLGFQKAHFDVRKGNEHVWKYHERFGAIRIDESKQDLFYRIDNKSIAAARYRYQKYLPGLLTIET